jgi:hypothetical protein
MQIEVTGVPEWNDILKSRNEWLCYLNDNKVNYSSIRLQKELSKCMK